MSDSFSRRSFLGVAAAAVAAPKVDLTGFPAPAVIRSRVALRVPLSCTAQPT